MTDAPQAPVPFRYRVGSWVLFAIGLVPLRLRSSLGRLAGSIAWRFSTPDRQIALLQTQWRLPEQSSQQVVKGVYRSICETLFETLNLFPILQNMDNHVECDDLSALLAIRDSGRPAVFLSAHLGNWDLLAAIGVKLGFNLHAIGTPARKMFLQQVLAEVRSRYGVRTIWRKRGSAKRLLKILNSGGSIAALIDQDTSVRSVPSSFFGIPASTPYRLLQLARSAGAGVVSVFLVRTSTGRYRVEARAIDTALNDCEMLAAYHSHLEELVRRYPDQWVWFHKRWRTLSDGKRLSSKQYIEYLQEQCQSQKL